MITSAASRWLALRRFSAISISAKPLTTVTGVRSSCETVSTKSSFIRSIRSRSCASRSQRGGHLVEGAAQGLDLDRAAGLDPGLQVAAGDPPGAGDQSRQRRAHRVDQAGEEDQRRDQGPGEARAAPGSRSRGCRRAPRCAAASRASRACLAQLFSPAVTAVVSRSSVLAGGSRPGSTRLGDGLAPGGLGRHQRSSWPGQAGVALGQLGRPLGRGLKRRRTGPGARRRACVRAPRTAACSRMNAERSRSPCSSSWKWRVIVLVVDPDLEQSSDAEQGDREQQGKQQREADTKPCGQ